LLHGLKQNNQHDSHVSNLTTKNDYLKEEITFQCLCENKIHKKWTLVTLRVPMETKVEEETPNENEQKPSTYKVKEIT
jgi:hypothetical protein